MDVAPDSMPVFITGRFRSGSTLLWQIFEQQASFRAYYEPCHDGLPSNIRYTQPMPSHRGVRDYWTPYQDILEEVEKLHDPSFGVTRLILDADDSFPALATYLHFLIDRAAPRRAALQFNRVDFRLPWLRAHFPDATVIHIYRDPRESYASMTRHLDRRQRDNPAARNVYELLEWSASLAGAFPFLSGDAQTTYYERHYYLWKLSLIMGEHCADVSISFDDEIQADATRGLQKLVDAGCLEPKAIEQVRGLIQPVEIGEWSLWHDDSWYEAIEDRCEQTLEALGLDAWFGKKPLAEIRASHPEAWEKMKQFDRQRVVDELLTAYGIQRAEVTRLLHEVRSRDYNTTPTS